VATNQTTQPKTRERILEAALDVFADEGFNGTTITEIERRVGLAAGTGSLYRHFPSKEALLRAAVEREVKLRRAEMEQARAELQAISDPLERRTQEFKQMLRDIRRFDRLYRLMLNEGDRVPELREAIWSALQTPVREQPTEQDAITAIAMAALGGYHLFSIMQGRPFNNVSQDQFIRTLIALVDSARPTEPTSSQ